MCGIFGVLVGEECAFSPAETRFAVRTLFRLSEARGKEASGLAIAKGDSIRVLKRPYSATDLMKRREFRQLLDEVIGRDGARTPPLAVIGHSRLVTDGVQSEHENNQPVFAGNMVGIHNGIVVNAAALGERFPDLERRAEVDSEVLFGLIGRGYRQSGSFPEAVRATYGVIEGTAAIAALLTEADELLLATNNGSLYLMDASGALLFASERRFLELLARRGRMRDHLERSPIIKVEPGSAHLVELGKLTRRPFGINGHPGASIPLSRPGRSRNVVDISASSSPARRAAPAPHESLDFARIRARNPFDETPLTSLRRCRRCILPETVPSIRFDADGVCNFCRGYRKLEYRGEEALRAVADRYRSKNGEPDCIVGLSGGRDSTYGLHYIKTVLGMNPVAYTYDWGMVTDLARRNIARICGKLGIEHLLVSADITRKRSHIRKNVSAWLEQPELGIVPLFMAGDKQYFYHAFRIRKEAGIELLFLCENMLERDYFKAGFAGAPAEFTDEDHIGHLGWLGNLKILLYYARNYLTNPGYLNASLLDTASAFLCYFVIERDYHNLYRYVPWDEKTVLTTLIDEYDWETATDTRQTWRIGDGTSPFYNFIYYNVAGFTENDNFFSNQIREGTITRDRAMELVSELNRPRFESIRWYCDTIGIDFEQTLAAIERIPKLYRK